MRAQTSLPALGVALVLLTTTSLFALAVADGQLATAEDDAVERAAAVAVSDRLVAADSAVTVRANVVDPDALRALTVSDLRATYGLGQDAAVRVRLDGEVLAATGGPEDGSSVERIVLVERRTTETVTPRFRTTRKVTLPRRSPNATLDIAPSNGTVETVRVNGDVLLHESGGLSGRYDVGLTRYETATLTFEGSGDLEQGDVTVAYRPARTHKARLVVTVERGGDPDG